MKLFNRDVPVEWLDILGAIQEHCPDAVLAGGCFRDLCLGGEVKDLDVFVRGAETVDALMAANPDWGWHAADEKQQDYREWAGSTIQAIFVFNVPDLDTPVNLICLDLPVWGVGPVLARMDIGACQAGTHGYEAVAYTEAFHDDITKRRMTIVNCPTVGAALSSIKRLQRFQARYGNSILYDGSMAEQVQADHQREIDAMESMFA